ISTAVNSPPDLAACAMVSAAATAIGRNRQLEPTHDWRSSPRLHMAPACDAGRGETPALRKSMRPRRGNNHDWEKEYAKDQDIFEVEKIAYEASKKEFMKHVAKRTKRNQSCRQ